MIKHKHLFFAIFLLFIILFYSIAEAGKPVPPLSPSNLTASAVSTSQINLAWSDNSMDETGFKLERASSASGPWTEIAALGANVTSYQNTGISASTTYYYRTYAYNKTGNSSYSNTASATTQTAVTIPNAPSNLTATAVSSSQINLSWTDNSTNETGFKVERAISASGPFSQIGTTAANVTTYQNTGLTASTIYYYRVRANNTAGDSGYSNTANATTQSAVTIPNAPSGLAATAVSSSQINVSWTDSSTNESGFKIERSTSATSGFSQIATVGANITSYQNSGLSASTTYYYRVCAYNSAGDSIYSNTASATTQSATVIIPAAPTNLTAIAISSSQINLAWNDNSGNETGFHVWRYHSSVGWTQIAIVGANTASYSDTGLSASTTYQYAVRAYNSAGVSSWSNTVPATTLSGTGDVTPPTVSITSPSNNTTYTSAQTVIITASASDNVGITKVDFYDGATLQGTDTASPFTYSWAFTSSNNGTHTWTAKAYDASGNSTISSGVNLIVNIPVADTTPPTGSITINSGAAYANILSVTLTLSASDNSGSVSQMCISNTTSCTAWETYAGSKAWTLTTGDGTKTVYVWYKDGAGNANTSPYSDSIILDTTPPSSSIIINSGAAYTKTTSVTLTLSASDSLSGVSQMCLSNTGSCTSWETYATSKAWTLTTGDGTKTVYVWYKDGAGNANTSPYSDSIILDTTAPPVPSGLTATAVSSSQINLNWSAVVDTSGGSGLAGYKVYRSVTQIATTTATNYQDPNLTANTQYCYRITSYDVAGNESGQCTQACATTQAGSLPGGSLLWSDTFGSTGNDEGKAVAFDTAGNMVVTGSFKGSVDFGGGPLVAHGSYADIYIAKYSASGVHLWSKSFGGNVDDKGLDVAIDSSGNIVLTGYFALTVDFGGGLLTATGGEDMFVAKFSSTGQHLWSKRFGGSNPSHGQSIAVDGGGNILLTGYFQGWIDFGGGQLPSNGSFQDVFVAKLSPSGSHIWSKGFGGIDADYGNGIAVDASGNVAVVGRFTSTMDVGGGPLLCGGGNDAFVVMYAASGQHLWSKGLGNTSEQYAWSVAFESGGNVIMAGSFSGTIDFGGGILTNNTLYPDIFVAKLSPSGAHIWSKKFGSTSSDQAYGVAVDGTGNVVITGYFIGPADFGGGPLASTGMDIFVAKYSPSGNHLWSRSFGGSSSDIGNAVAIDGTGNVLLTGTFQSAIDFGTGQVTSAGALDMFLVKLAP